MAVSASEDILTVGKIPIRNLWLLIFYASDLHRNDETSRKDVEENPDDLIDIVAEILCYHVEKRLRRNLSFGYQNKVATLNRVRGRIDLLYTESHQLLSKAEVHCRFAELTVDTPRNRYVRAALQYLTSLKQLDKERKHKYRMLAMQLEALGVGRQKPPNYGAKSERFGLHDSADRLMLYAADLAFSLALPNDIDGDHYMLSPAKDINWLRKLFEKAVLGFYTIRLRDKCEVKSEYLQWDRQEETEKIKDILPQMQTDISIKNKSSGERLIIDTKFNEITIKGQYRDQALRNNYIYQIYAYVKSQERREDKLSWSTTGMLLHPEIGEDYDESVTIQGHEFKFCTVNLAAEAKHITARLLDILPTQFAAA